MPAVHHLFVKTLQHFTCAGSRQENHRRARDPDVGCGHYAGGIRRHQSRPDGSCRYRESHARSVRHLTQSDAVPVVAVPDRNTVAVSPVRKPIRKFVDSWTDCEQQWRCFA